MNDNDRPTIDMSTVDLNEVRETKRIEKKIESDVQAVRDLDFNGALSAMFVGDAFTRYVTHAERVIPPTSPLTTPPLPQIVGAVVQSFITEMSLEDAKLYFCNMLDWIHETYVAQHGRPPWPVLCDGCAEHSPEPHPPTG